MQSDFNVYYQTAKGNTKRLHHFLVQDVEPSDREPHEEAIQEVMSMLHTNMEAYFRPVLAVINGGKS